MKRFFIAVPVFALITVTSCTEEPPVKEEAPVERIETPKPLLEREPEVKDYFDTMKELVDEYVSVGETLLSLLENIDSGNLDYIESAYAAKDLLESWDKIDRINESMEEHEDLKTTIEKKLNAKDLLEFSEKYGETMQRVDSLSQRIAESELQKYVPQ